MLDQAAKALKVMPDAIEALKSPVSTVSHDSKESQVGQNSSEQQFHWLYDMVKEQEKRRKGLQDQAEQANKAVRLSAPPVITLSTHVYTMNSC